MSLAPSLERDSLRYNSSRYNSLPIVELPEELPEIELQVELPPQPSLAESLLTSPIEYGKHGGIEYKLLRLDRGDKNWLAKGGAILFNIGQVFKSAVQAVAYGAEKLSEVTSFDRHLVPVLIALGKWRNTPAYNPLINALVWKTILSDSLESVNSLNWFVNGAAYNAYTEKKIKLLVANGILFGANLISLQFCLQDLGLRPLKTTWLTSDLIPARLYGLVKYVANHTATSYLTAFLPRFAKEGAEGVKGHANRVLGTSLLAFTMTVGFLTYFYLAKSIDEDEKANWGRKTGKHQALKDSVRQNSAKFWNGFGTGVLGIENTYAKAALGLYAAVAVGINEFRNKVFKA